MNEEKEIELEILFREEKEWAIFGPVGTQRARYPDPIRVAAKLKEQSSAFANSRYCKFHILSLEEILIYFISYQIVKATDSHQRTQT